MKRAFEKGTHLNVKRNANASSNMDGACMTVSLSDKCQNVPLSFEPGSLHSMVLRKHFPLSTPPFISQSPLQFNDMKITHDCMTDGDSVVVSFCV